MALAVLEFVGENKGKIWFKIDTGSNPYFQVKIGKGILSREGNQWVDGVAYSSQLGRNESGGQLLNSSKTIAIPAERLDRNTSYVQLFTYKSADGKSPAFSRVVKVPLGFSMPRTPGEDLRAFSLSTAMNTVDFQRPRTVTCRTCKQAFSQQASIEDLLAGIVKIAGPVVMDALSKAGPAAGGGGTATGSDAGSMIASLLKTILGAIGNPAPATSAPAVGSPAAGGSKPLSLPDDNRFSKPFIFGIDDALLASLAGPVLQVLPQLVNAANAQRLAMKQEDNKLMSGIVSDVQKRLMMDQVLAAQKQQAPAAAPGTPSAEDIRKVLEMLAASQATAPATGPVSTTKSLSVDPTALSTKAVLAFDFAAAVQWQGASKILFARSQPVQLNVKLAIAEPAPKAPLSKAIVRVVFKDADHKQIFEKTFKQKAISANAPMPLAFTAEEMARIPANQSVSIVAEMRWMTSRGERKALGSAEVIFIDKYFVKEKGSSVSGEVELRDMNRFRAFWNKVWEAPILDAATNRGDNKKYSWELDTAAKYTVLLSSEHDTNGLMQTKVMKAAVDAERPIELIEGKLKAGIELSLAEVNKLAVLFDKATPLTPEQFQALNTAEFAKVNSAELTYPLKLKGKAGQRGAVWISPIFRLFEITLGTAQKADATGQITAVTDEKVRFPLPVSVRVIGLKSA